jgi:ribosome-binding protein aMBF1 (putative translation factor)
MIRNARQYRITKAQLAKLDQALAQVTGSHEEPPASIHPRLRQAERDALKSQIEDLRVELAAYDTLRTQKRSVFSLKSFTEFPRTLIQARIAAGMTQKDLAERLHLKEQQIQRYEATEYASASFARVTKVTQALGLKVTVVRKGKAKTAKRRRRAMGKPRVETSSH